MLGGLGSISDVTSETVAGILYVNKLVSKKNNPLICIVQYLRPKWPQRYLTIN